MDWKLLLASLLVVVLNVSSQGTKSGQSMCTVGNRRYKPGETFASLTNPDCTCKCEFIRGQLVENCDTAQCKPKTYCDYYGTRQEVNAVFDHVDGPGCGKCFCKVNGKVECGNKIPGQCKTPATTPPTRPTPARICAASGSTLGSIRQLGEMWESPDKCTSYRCVNGNVESAPKVCRCMHKGKAYPLGANFNEDCNSCKCQNDGNMQCTNKPCFCTFNGRQLRPGESVAAPDGCNKCTCTQAGNNLVMSCTEKPCQCTRNGQTYRIGQQFPAGDGCNTCMCNSNGVATCSERPCSCNYESQVYAIGQSFPKDCNTCVCQQSGTVVCTLQACGCPHMGRMVAVGEIITGADGCTRLTCAQNGANLVSDNGVKCTCNDNGMKYNRGATWAKRGDNCGNTCTCGADLRIKCDNNVCCRDPATNAITRVGERRKRDECNDCFCLQSGQWQCENKICFCIGSAGQKYKVGLSWVHTDGCNTCTCTQGGLIACGDKPCHCEYNGQKYQIGDTTIRNMDGCQTGQCNANGNVVFDGKKCQCNHMGRIVQIGETFPKGDGCNQCRCNQDGTVVCDTNPVPCSCPYQGSTLRIGETRQQDCNTCECLSTGTVRCTTNPCSCTRNGRTYRIGERFAESCNTCTCQPSGQVDCTTNPCGCTAAGRTYNIGEQWNPDECNTCSCQQNGQPDCTNNPVPCSCNHMGQIIPVGTKVQRQCNTCECKVNGNLECSENPCECNYQGMTYNIGQEFNLAERPCAKCRCLTTGQVDCDSTSCPITAGCSKNDTMYKVGETFEDDCNTCKCVQPQGGKPIITCTQKTCGCQDPAKPGEIFKVGQFWQKEGNCITCECLASYNMNCVKTCNTKTGRR